VLTTAEKNWWDKLVQSACEEKNMSYSVTNSPIKAGEDKKLTKMTKRTIYVVVAVANAVKKVQQGKSLTEPASRRLWPSPACFSSQKVPDYHSRTGCYAGTKPQSTL
jgi:hypothetical protein